MTSLRILCAAAVWAFSGCAALRPSPPQEGEEEEALISCAQDLASCPASGCDPIDSARGLANRIKKRLPERSDASVPLTFAQLHTLQQSASQVVPDHQALSAVERERLVRLDAGEGVRVREGDVVRIAGFIVSELGEEGSHESVNCRLHGEGGTDTHLALGASPGSSEFESVVVEVIPQHRPDGWRVKALDAIRRSQRPVLAVGPLFYDSQHLPNGDAAHPQGRHPKRFTLWEIHPVVKLYACDGPAKCDVSSWAGWKEL